MNGLRSRIVLFILCFQSWTMVQACEVCFGNPDDPQTKGVQAAIITLLVITYVTLTAIIGFFIWLFRRGSRLNQTRLET